MAIEKYGRKFIPVALIYYLVKSLKKQKQTPTGAIEATD